MRRSIGVWCQKRQKATVQNRGVNQRTLGGVRVCAHAREREMCVQWWRGVSCCALQSKLPGRTHPTATRLRSQPVRLTVHHAVHARREMSPTRSAQITHLPTPVEPKLLHGVRHIGPGSSDRECKDKPIGIDLLHSCLPQPARLALPLQQHEDVALTDRTLDVPHDRARGIVEELNAHLDHRAGLASAAEDLGHLRELDGLILRRGAGGQGPSATASGSPAGLRPSRQGATVQRGPRMAPHGLHTRLTSTCAD